GARAGLKCHVTDLERRGGNLPFRFECRSRRARSRDIPARSHYRRQAQAADEAAPIYPFVHISHSCVLVTYRQIFNSSTFAALLAKAARAENFYPAISRHLPRHWRRLALYRHLSALT